MQGLSYYQSFGLVHFSKQTVVSVVVRPRNHDVPSSIPRSGCQLLDFHWPTHYWCSSMKAKSRENRISCKNLFINRCKIDMFELSYSSLIDGMRLKKGKKTL